MATKAKRSNAQVKCEECQFELATGRAVPEGVVHTCDARSTHFTREPKKAPWARARLLNWQVIQRIVCEVDGQYYQVDLFLSSNGNGIVFEVRRDGMSVPINALTLDMYRIFQALAAEAWERHWNKDLRIREAPREWVEWRAQEERTRGK